MQNKIESNLGKSLDSQLNIQLQQQMGFFQASILEAMKSLRDKMQSMKQASKVVVDQISASVSKAGPSKQPDLFTHPITRPSDHLDVQPMETDLCGPLPDRFSVQSDHGT